MSLRAWLEAEVRRCLDGAVDECVAWPGVLQNGYGRCWSGKRLIGAHRAALEMSTGVRADWKVEAVHECGRRDCVNPHHLRWQRSRAAIAADERLRARRLVEAGCSGKLDAEQVRWMREQFAAGVAPSDLAERCGCRVSKLYSIRRGETWKSHVAGFVGPLLPG